VELQAVWRREYHHFFHPTTFLQTIICLLDQRPPLEEEDRPPWHHHHLPTPKRTALFLQVLSQGKLLKWEMGGKRGWAQEVVLTWVDSDLVQQPHQPLGGLVVVVVVVVVVVAVVGLALA